MAIINIRDDGNVDNPHAHVNKTEVVRWNSLGPKAWSVSFRNESPLDQGSPIYVPSNGPSQKCTVHAKARLDEYPYDVLPEVGLQEKPLTTGPRLIVEAGDGLAKRKRTKQAAAKSKRAAARKKGKAAAAKTKKAAVPRAGARKITARKRTRKSPARKTRPATARKRVAKKR